MNEEEKNAIEYLKNRLYGNEDCKYIDVAQEDLRVFIKLIEKLQKENEELRNKLSLKQFDIKVVYTDYLEKLNEYKENSISIQKVKDKIEKYKKLSDKFYVKFLESDRYNTDIREKGIKCDAIILALEELIEEREEK